MSTATRGLRRWASLATLLGVALSGPVSLAQTSGQEVALSGPLRYQVFAGAARLNRRVTGPVTRFVHGVPAEPVDSMVYDGNGSVPVEGQFIMEVDPIGETGFLQAQWTDEHGDWVLTQVRFVHPEHSSGVRLGGSVTTLDSIINEGITHNVYLHGDTGAGMPVLPTVYNHLAIWGPVDVRLNGQPFINPFGLPGPEWLGHTMVTEGVREPDGTVRDRNGGIYDPTEDGSNGYVDPSDLEVHLVFHDERFPTTENHPGLFSFFYHLVFEDVVIQLVQADRPIILENGIFVPAPIEPEPGQRAPQTRAGS